MKSKFFSKHILQHTSLLKEIFLHEFEEKKPSRWIKQVNKYMLDLQFTLHTIECSKPKYIRKIIKEYDDKVWHEDLQKKNLLILYREYKHVIHDEQDL